MKVELFAKLDGKMFRLTPCDEGGIERGDIERGSTKKSCSIIEEYMDVPDKSEPADCTTMEQAKELDWKLREVTSLTSLGVTLWGPSGKGKIFRLLRDFGMIKYSCSTRNRRWYPIQPFKRFFTEEVLYLKHMTHPVVKYRIRKEILADMVDFLLSLERDSLSAGKPLVHNTGKDAVIKAHNSKYKEPEDLEQGQLRLGF